MKTVDFETYKVIMTNDVYEHFEDEIECYGPEYPFTDMESIVGEYVFEPCDHEEEEYRILNYMLDNGDVFMKFGHEHICKFEQKYFNISFNEKDRMFTFDERKERYENLEKYLIEELGKNWREE